MRDSKEITTRVSEALEMVDLTGEEKKMPAELSGGMRKRVGLARTIVGRPRCILYDEPTTGLDPITTDGINHMIRRLQRRLSVTSIVVTHDMKTAFHCADRVAFLHEGRRHFLGTVDELRASNDPVLRDFIEGRSGETD
jgi:phospholipid/cholesterol/gamma-HCH transport system ATP-binding protein